MTRSPGIDVAVILVNFHSEAFTRRCIRSVVEQTRGVRYEILVIDNHSNLDYESLKKEWPQVRVLVSERNLGFGLANNVASAYSSARYFFFLNNDCVLLNDAASILFRWMELHPSAGLSGAQLVSPGGRPIVSFDYFPTLATKFVGVAPLRALGAGRFPRKDGSVRSATEVDVVTGAALFVRAETFRSLGGFDARLFLYCEEEDLAKRMWDAGHAVWFVPEAAVEHAGGGSSFNKTALRKEFYISFFLFYRKHYGAARTRAIQAFTIVQVIWRLLWRGERDLWKPLLGWLLRGMPESESLRYAAGNVDAPEVRDAASLVREVVS